MFIIKTRSCVVELHRGYKHQVYSVNQGPDLILILSYNVCNDINTGRLGLDKTTACFTLCINNKQF